MNEPHGLGHSTQSPVESTTSKKPNILLIDDDRAILQSFRKLLASEGYDVDTAETGRDGVQMAENHYYDLAVIDVKLPDVEGTRLLTELRKRSPDMKKVIMTGFPSLENAASSVNLQADAYVMKPVSPEEFLRVVKEKLSEHEEEERMTEDKVMDWVETRYVKAKHQSSSLAEKDRSNRPQAPQ